MHECTYLQYMQRAILNISLIVNNRQVRKQRDCFPTLAISAFSRRAITKLVMWNFQCFADQLWFISVTTNIVFCSLKKIFLVVTISCFLVNEKICAVEKNVLRYASSVHFFSVSPFFLVFFIKC